MDNQTCIVCTKFVNLYEEDNPDAATFGIRIVDDYHSECCNLFDEETVRAALADPQECVNIIREHGDTDINDILEFAVNNGGTIEINGKHYMVTDGYKVFPP